MNSFLGSWIPVFLSIFWDLHFNYPTLGIHLLRIFQLLITRTLNLAEGASAASHKYSHPIGMPDNK